MFLNFLLAKRPDLSSHLIMDMVQMDSLLWYFAVFSNHSNAVQIPGNSTLIFEVELLSVK